MKVLVSQKLNKMLNRYGMDRFKKAESAEPFSLKPGTIKQVLSQPQPQPPAPTEAQVAAVCQLFLLRKLIT